MISNQNIFITLILKSIFSKKNYYKIDSNILAFHNKNPIKNNYSSYPN